MKTLKNLTGMVAAMLILLLPSCSKESATGSMADHIPSSAKAVARIDLSKTLRQAGCPADPASGAITLSAPLQRLLGDNSVALALVRLVPAIDATAVYTYKADTLGINAVVTFSITDDTEFAKIAHEAATDNGQTTPDGIDLYGLARNLTLAKAESTGWLIDGNPEAAGKFVKAILQLPSGNSLARYSGVASFLSEEPGTAAVAISPSTFGIPTGDGRWICAVVTTDDPAINIRATQITPDGKKLPLSDSEKTIDTDFLNHIPSGFIFSAAICSNDIDWDKAVAFVGLVGGYEYMSYIRTAASFLSQIDGTLAIGFGPAGGAPGIADINLSTWDFIIMGHMPEATVDSSLGMLRTQASALGLTVTTGDDGTYSVSLPDGTKIHAGNIGGYLAVSNREFSSGNPDTFSDTFEGQQAAMALLIPAGSETVKAFNLPWGFNLTCRVNNTETNIRLTLNGVDGCILQNIIEAIDRHR